MKKKKESIYQKRVRENNKGKSRPVYAWDGTNDGRGHQVDDISKATKQLKDKKKRNKKLVANLGKRAKAHNKSKQRQK